MSRKELLDIIMYIICLYDDDDGDDGDDEREEHHSIVFVWVLLSWSVSFELLYTLIIKRCFLFLHSF